MEMSVSYNMGNLSAGMGIPKICRNISKIIRLIKRAFMQHWRTKGLSENLFEIFFLFFLFFLLHFTVLALSD